MACLLQTLQKKLQMKLIYLYSLENFCYHFNGQGHGKIVHRKKCINSLLTHESEICSWLLRLKLNACNRDPFHIIGGLLPAFNIKLHAQLLAAYLKTDISPLFSFFPFPTIGETRVTFLLSEAKLSALLITIHKNWEILDLGIEVQFFQEHVKH